MRPTFVTAIGSLSQNPDVIERVLESIGFGVFVDHTEKGCIYANRHALQMFDMAWEEFCGFGWASAVLPEDVETLRQAIERYEVEKTKIEVRYRIRAGSEIRSLHVVGNAIVDDDNQQLGSVMIGRDVTDERLIADRLVTGQKLEAVGRLASGIAHDLNNVLTPILFSTSLLESNSPDKTVAFAVDTIVNGVDHATAMTRQLLGLSKEKSQGRRLACLDEQIESMQGLLRQSLPPSIVLECELQAGDVQVGLASHEVAQIILNLVVNARDAIADSGLITLQSAADDQLVTLQIRDTGTGIGEEIRQKVFEPFFSTKPQEKGTGLGLYTVRDLVRQAGGELSFETTDNGTCFNLVLPNLGPSESLAEKSEAGGQLPEDTTVLVVEDNSALRQTLAYVLALRRIKVLTTSSVAGARELLADSQVDVLVSDLLLPDGSGVDMVSELRATNGQLAVVYMTGYAGDLDASSSLDEPGTTLLRKPFHPNQLLGAIGRVMRELEAGAVGVSDA